MFDFLRRHAKDKDIIRLETENAQIWLELGRLKKQIGDLEKKTDLRFSAVLEGEAQRVNEMLAQGLNRT